jgi:hypothetical protein
MGEPKETDNLITFEEFEVRKWRKCSAEGKQFTSFWDLPPERQGMGFEPVPCYTDEELKQWELTGVDPREPAELEPNGNAYHGIFDNVRAVFLRGVNRYIAKPDPEGGQE